MRWFLYPFLLSLAFGGLLLLHNPAGTEALFEEAETYFVTVEDALGLAPAPTPPPHIEVKSPPETTGTSSPWTIGRGAGGGYGTTGGAGGGGGSVSGSGGTIIVPSGVHQCQIVPTSGTTSTTSTTSATIIFCTAPGVIFNEGK